MRVEHRIHRPKRFVDIKNIVQRTFTRNQDRLAAIKGCVNVAHDAARAVAGCCTVTKSLVVFSVANGQNIGQHSLFTLFALFRKNSLCQLL